MSIKVTIGSEPQPEIKSLYPCIMEADGLIILATKKGTSKMYDSFTGIVLQNRGVGNYKIGQYSDTWNLEVFEKFNKSVILENE